IGTTDSTFRSGVYRVAGASWNNYLLFGPAMNGSISVNQIWGVRITGDTLYTWTNFQPKTIDTVGNISTFAVKSGTDTNYFFLFGGVKNPNVVSSAQKYTFASPPIGIINTGNEIPGSFQLLQNYPNPFNPVTHFEFLIPEFAHVRITISDVLGRKISELFNEYLRPGTYKADFDGSSLSSGLYFYTLSSGKFHQTKKMLLLK